MDYQIRDTSSSSRCDIIKAVCDTWLQAKAISADLYADGISVAVWYKGELLYSLGEPALMDA